MAKSPSSSTLRVLAESPAAKPQGKAKKSDTAGLILPDRDEMAAYHLYDERRLVGGLIERAVYTEDERRRIGDIARNFVHQARANRDKFTGSDNFMHEYELSSEEGIILMCLAESLLRIPDRETADALIAEKIGEGQWDKHFGSSDSLFVNASTFGLMLTGRVVKLGADKRSGAAGALKRMIAKSGEPFIRQALRQAMRVLGDNFVLGRNIKEAISRAAVLEKKGYRFSYDMLGECARTPEDADRYFTRYMDARAAVGDGAGPQAQRQLVHGLEGAVAAGKRLQFKHAALRLRRPWPGCRRPGRRHAPRGRS